MALPRYLVLSRAEYIVWVSVYLPDVPQSVIAASFSLLPYPFIFDECDGEPLVIVPLS